jgi:hypothetical protein
MSKLFIGPWVGEFGIELLRWQGYARTVAREGDWEEIIVATHPSRFFLYEDFATRFIAYDPPSENRIANRCDDYIYDDLHRQYIDHKGKDIWLSPIMDKARWDRIKWRLATESTYIDFSTRAFAERESFDLLVHARSTDKRSEHCKNWPRERWDELIALLGDDFSIASVGSLEGAWHIPGTEDRRGVPLAELAAYCRDSRLMVGPSSGPVHFAIFSSTPVVTWIHENSPYQRRWNPFDVPICCLQTWQPSPEVVLSKIQAMLSALETQPLKHMIFGTKRSGHHAVVDWLAGLEPALEITHLNDCSVEDIASMPHESCVIPSARSLPKLLNEDKANKAVHVYRPGAGEKLRFLSYEEIPLERIVDIPESHETDRLVFVLRDAANFFASLKKGLDYFRDKPFTHEAFGGMLEVYKGYLREALGRTDQLGALGEKAVFISYNRWHLDKEYRQSIAEGLGLGYRDADRREISPYGPGSSFDGRYVPDARQLDVLGRWRYYATREKFWEALEERELRELEEAFHGEAMPDTDITDWPASGSPSESAVFPDLSTAPVPS